jgi:hypothetical protein
MTSSGEQMNVQVMHLLSQISVHGDQHLAEASRICADGRVADEAIKTAQFHGDSSRSDLQQEALNGLLASACLRPSMRPGSRTAWRDQPACRRRRIGLQFQDMTSQLIGRWRVTGGVRDVFGALASTDRFPESSNEALQRWITSAIGDDTFFRNEAVRSTVNQRHDGDIEFF